MKSELAAYGHYILRLIYSSAPLSAFSLTAVTHIVACCLSLLDYLLVIGSSLHVYLHPLSSLAPLHANKLILSYLSNKKLQSCFTVRLTVSPLPCTGPDDRLQLGNCIKLRQTSRTTTQKGT